MAKKVYTTKNEGVIRMYNFGVLKNVDRFEPNFNEGVHFVYGFLIFIAFIN